MWHSALTELSILCNNGAESGWRLARSLAIAASRSANGRAGCCEPLSRRRIHFNEDVDGGRQGEDVEDVDDHL